MELRRRIGIKLVIFTCSFIISPVHLEPVIPSAEGDLSGTTSSEAGLSHVSFLEAEGHDDQSSEVELERGPAYLKDLQHWRRRREAARGSTAAWWKNIFNFGKEKEPDGRRSSTQSSNIVSYSAINQHLPEVSRSYVGRPAKLANVRGVPGSTRNPPGPRYGGKPARAPEDPEPSNLTRVLGGFLPNTYFSRPRFRYPYYDRGGKGYLLYGYGDKDLYEYSVFKPLEGYY